MERNKAAEKLNELLAGEISAIETYEQALHKVGDEEEAKEIRRIRSEHVAAADSLRAQIEQLGSTPTTSSGPWGSWAKTVTGTAKLFGDTAAVKALKEGEEHGRKQYEDAIGAPHLPPGSKKLIHEVLLPQQHEHITVLDRIIDTIH